MRYTIRHTFNTDADTFWGKLFFDPAYNEALFKQHLKFNFYKVLELQHAPDGSVHRRVECAPPVEVPASGTRAEKTSVMTQALADAFATGIADHPEDWHMLQRLWLADLDPAAGPAADPAKGSP